MTFFDSGESLLATLSTISEEDFPSFILLDLDMPAMNGYEVLRSLRDSPRLHAIPVLVLSGRRDEQNVRAAYELGANSFMSKPNTFDELRALLEKTYIYWLETAHTPRHP